MRNADAADCLFCKIVNREIPGDIVYEDDEVLAFSDINPQAPVHILVVPKLHVATINDLGQHDDEFAAALIGTLVLRARDIAAQKGIDDAGYRLFMNCNDDGGQTVFHVHLHLLGGRSMRALG